MRIDSKKKEEGSRSSFYATLSTIALLYFVGLAKLPNGNPQYHRPKIP